MTSSKTSSTSKPDTSIKWQRSKSKASGGLSPQADMTKTVLCQMCYPSGSLPDGQTLTSHHPRGRWSVIPKGGKTLQVCTRHHSKVLAEGGKLTSAVSKSLEAHKSPQEASKPEA